MVSHLIKYFLFQFKNSCFNKIFLILVLGFDWIGEKTTLGLVLCIYADAGLTLDGDGGFSLCSGGSQHVFKPVSVHVLWAVIQSLHKACDRAQKYNHYPGGGTHRWVESYRITSDRSSLNEWNYLPDVESRRPPSPQDQKADRERLIRSTLKEVMMTLDLDDVTSVDIRRRVEEELQMDLTDQKSFLDTEMLTILGQMDGASRIFDDLFLGSEWNASNLEELERNGIGHILNVTREIDNFFPDQFDYLNIRVYDDEATELLKHWDRTFKYIRRAVEDGSKVLVHCKMGVSRSASVVIAYAMKVRHWDLPQALKHVKDRRACVKPNASFMQQLEIYAGILDASRQRHNKLWRSKSETNLAAKVVGSIHPVRRLMTSQDKEQKQQQSGSATGSSVPNSPTRQQQKQISVITELLVDSVDQQQEQPDEKDSPMDTLDILEGDLGRPKSWSPDDSLAETFFPSQPEASETELQESTANRTVCVSLRVPCSNGRTYSVSQNRAVKLESSPPPPPPPPPANFFFEPSELSLNFDSVESFNGVVLEVPGESGTDPDASPLPEHFTSLPRVGSVKDRIYELEAASVLPGTPVPTSRPTGLVLNIKNPWQFGSNSPQADPVVADVLSMMPGVQSKPVPTTSSVTSARKRPEQEVKISDVFSDRVDRVFEREERRQSDGSIPRESPLRQRSWGATETRSRAVPVTNNTNSDSPSIMPSYSSDPSLPTIPSEEQQDSSLPNECSRGLVRMQREALEKANNGHQQPQQQRRSLPEESVSNALLLSRSISDTAETSTEGISVMRLRKALEAKATCPLTGSFAPPQSVLAALAAASSQSTQTSPTRQRPAAGRERLRKRSLSLERMTYSPGNIVCLT